MKNIRRFLCALSLWSISGVPESEFDTPLDWHTACQVAKIIYP